MNREEILKFIESNPDNFAIQLKRKHPGVFNQISSEQYGNTFGEKMYQHINGLSFGKCEVCGNQCKFISYYKGYSNTCSYKCLNSKKIVPAIKKTCPICSIEFGTDKAHNRVTCSKKCQMEYIARPDVSVARIESAKKGMLKKYGVDHASHLPGFGKKVKATKLKNHGDENYVNSNLAKKTKLEKYGAENYTNIDKFKQTCLTKYGVDNPSKSPKTIEKTNKTKLDKFGEQMISDEAMAGVMDRLDKNIMGYHSPNFSASMLEKYGTLHCMQNPDISNRAANTTMDKFFDTLIHGTRLGGEIVPLFSRVEYRGTREKDGTQIFYKFRCNTCSTEFAASIEDGNIPICKKCNPAAGRSKAETDIFEFLKAHLPPDCEIRQNDRQCIAPLELDFYIPSKNVAIEFDGIIWHSEMLGGKDRGYHIAKTKSANANGVKLIHIFEPEWVKTPDIVKRKILKLIGSNDKILESNATPQSTISESVIYARKCLISDAESGKVYSDFLEKYHIQGKDNSSIKLGAYYKNELVAVMTFGKKRVALGTKIRTNDDYEMYRFAVGKHPVVGVGSKLLQHFIKTHNPNSILTFADIRYSGMSAFYEKIGFTFAGLTPPNYWYFHKSAPYELKHRFGFQKAALGSRLEKFDPAISEWENMKAGGFDRIWDCGNLKYIWTNPVGP